MMFDHPHMVRRVSMRLCMAVAICLAGMLVSQQASAGVFVDAGLKELAAEQKVTVATPQPVQLLFSFTTKNAPNAQATKYLKDTVFEAVRASGLFSEVSEAPAPNGALLNIVIDNLAPPPGTATSAFATGFTFGLKGTLVTDRYTCEVTFQPAIDAATIKHTGQHALHTTIGNVSPPADAVQAKNAVEGAKTMTVQIVANTLNQVAADPLFAATTVSSVVAQQPAASPILADPSIQPDVPANVSELAQ
jgi:hypothetical protein